MAEPLYLALVLHHHQPVGNYGFVFEQVYRDAYLPLLEAIERRPAIRVSLHYSGPLIDWLEEHHSDFLPRVAAMAARGQAEILGGAYYEPILPGIPEADRFGQLVKMGHALRHWCGHTPEGAWIAERVWEPSLPATLRRAGIRYTLVDDHHLELAGVAPDDVAWPAVTEDDGQPVVLFASSQVLRYAIPWKDVDEARSLLRDRARERPGSLWVFGDDGEKFGSWPGTRALCWQEGWFDRFLDMLEEAADWCRTVTLREALDRVPARGPVYLPAASYEEMMGWALPPARQRDLERARELLAAEAPLRSLLSGTTWRQFLWRYPEANSMHKRVLRVHDKLQRLRRIGDHRHVQDLLWKAECNCPYWHGVFGGLYLRRVRGITHRNLAAAEGAADRALHGGYPFVEHEVRDFDQDGQDEALLASDGALLLVHPALGGALSEWDLREPPWQLLHTLARRPEAYHAALAAAGEPSGEAKNIHGALRRKGGLGPLAYDRTRRLGGMLWLLPPDEDAATLTNGQPTRGEPLGLATERQTDEARDRYVELRTVHPHGPGRVVRTTRLEAGDAGFTMALDLGDLAPATRPALEWNVNPPQRDEADDRTAVLRVEETEHDLNAAGTTCASSRFVLRGSEAVALEAECDPPAELAWYPVTCISASEGGVESVLQGFALVMLWPAGTRRVAVRWQQRPYSAGAAHDG